MWRTQYGNRILEGAEAIVFAEAFDERLEQSRATPGVLADIKDEFVHIVRRKRRQKLFGEVVDRSLLHLHTAVVLEIQRLGRLKILVPIAISSLLQGHGQGRVCPVNRRDPSYLPPTTHRYRLNVEPEATTLCRFKCEAMSLRLRYQGAFSYTEII